MISIASRSTDKEKQTSKMISIASRSTDKEKQTSQMISIASRSTDKEKQTSKMISIAISSAVRFQSKETKATNKLYKKKRLTRSTFCKVSRRISQKTDSSKKKRKSPPVRLKRIRLYLLNHLKNVTQMVFAKCSIKQRIFFIDDPAPCVPTSQVPIPTG